MQANGAAAAEMADEQRAPLSADTRGRHRIVAELKRLEQEAQFLEVLGLFSKKRETNNKQSQTQPKASIAHLGTHVGLGLLWRMLLLFIVKAILVCLITTAYRKTFQSQFNFGAAFVNSLPHAVKSCFGCGFWEAAAIPNQASKQLGKDILFYMLTILCKLRSGIGVEKWHRRFYFVHSSKLVFNLSMSAQEELEELEKTETVSTTLQELLQKVESRPDPLLPLTNGPVDPHWDRWFEGPQDMQGCRCWIF